MKNLRKIFALVLVVAMAFSFAAVASAKYTDDSSIKYSTAVGVMSGIGAINGKPGGGFDPTGLVTRAEAAKMIAYTILGPAVAGALPTAAATFKDVPTTHWASKYIEYCASKGIIGGRGDGNFDPSGNVTAIELAKMLLSAVGYGKNNEYTGANWAFAVLNDAFNNSVFLGNDTADFSKAATREEAALYIYNVLMNVQKVAYSKVTDTYTGLTTGTAPNQVAVTIGTSIYGMATVTGIVTANETTGLLSGTTNVDTATINATTGKITAFANGPLTYKFSSASKDIGQVMKVFYSATTAKVYYTETKSTTVNVYGPITTAAVYASTFGSVITAPAAQVYSFSNFVPTYNNAATLPGVTTGSAAGIGTYAMYAGQIISFVAPQTTVLDKVTAIVKTVGAESIGFSSTVSLSNTLTNDKVIEYTGIAVGDYVLRTDIGGGAFSLSKVTPVTATLSNVAYNTAAVVPYYSFTFDGVAYKDSAITDASGSSFITGTLTGSSFTIGAQYVLYLDAAGAIISAKGVSAAINYGYVAQYGQITTTNALGITTQSLAALIYFADGTSGLYALDTTTAGTPYFGRTYATGTTTGGGNVPTGGVFTWTINPVTKIAKATAVANPVGATGTVGAVDLDQINVTTGVATIGTDGADRMYADAASVVFYVTGTYNVIPSSNTLVVTPVTGISKFVSGATPFTSANYTTNTAGQKVLTVAVAPSAATVVAPTIVYFSGTYSDSTALVNGVPVTTRTYNIYKNGVADTVSYAAGAITAAGFYTTGAADLSAYSNNTFVLNATKTTDLFGSTLVVGGFSVQIDSAKIIDLTPGSVYTSLIVPNKTVSVAVDWTLNTVTGVRTANNIYVTAVSDYTATNATITNAKGLTITETHVVSGTTATYTVTIAGTTAAGGATITLANGTWAALNATGKPAGTSLTNPVITATAGDVFTAYTTTFTVTLTADNTPVPTITVA